jgi:hypothetical protein
MSSILFSDVKLRMQWRYGIFVILKTSRFSGEQTIYDAHASTFIFGSHSVFT